MDSLAGTQSFYEDAVDSRRKRTRLIVAVVLIALALAAAYYAFSASRGGAAGAEGAAAGGRGAASIPSITVVVPGRSEEHTSELQPLMRISYAVLCLKK